MNIEQRLLAALIKIKQDGPRDREYGICGNAYTILDPETPLVSHIMHRLIEENSRLWPKYSGDSLYPVPSPTRQYPMDEYEDSPDLWTGAYGELRYELLDFLINELTIKVGG